MGWRHGVEAQGMKGDGKRAGGDMDCQNLYEYASKTWETSSNNEVNIAEEIKSIFNIEFPITAEALDFKEVEDE